ncbi:hypothetical protein [Vibrio mediterranei]|jgi:hypothetical protein|uniref:TonB-dependent receptor n=1 Tax=Vibrio mediterranei TaxID=689 RepID=A0ABX5DLZ3_9VIBR|nr:hypothetical protein [Vibrio mediterranei]MCG9660952.1 hypothetical protein [Vibrio mediterranei]PCD89907.1 hypothetical protein COR52_01220 [Vibrio mediterranei]PRQ69291.1 hypothetical protein COR51_01495 [Vibrio mediterranei]SBO10493.1 hypothetical protein VME0621_02614 [Vibrio mediterranei]
MKPFIVLVTVLTLSSTSFAQDSIFPIWGEQAAQRGYTLPKPYGLSLSYMDISNPVTIDNINLAGGIGDIIDIEAKQAQFEGSNVTLRGDVWLLPFMNVYGILGYTQAQSTAEIDSISIIGIPIPVEDAKFTLDMSGITYGVGTTVVGGINNWFALLDLNYTYTDIDAIDGSIKTFVAAPRVGHRWQYTGGRELRVFVGAMYQDVQQHLSGDIKALGLDLGDMNFLIDDTRFEVSQRSEQKWNALAGFQYSLNRDWDILAEAGFGQRKSAFVSLGRRF